jgi:hypothetical protein
MKRISLFLMLAVFFALAGATWALDDATTDRYIKDLKNENPKVRAKAAYELGCG